MTIINTVKVHYYICVECKKSRRTQKQEKGELGLCSKCRKTQEMLKNQIKLFD